MVVSRGLGALLTGVLVAAGLSGVTGQPRAAASPDDPVAEYRDDAGVPLTVHHDGSGRVEFVGSRSVGALPVGRGVAPSRAARTQWDRIAPVFAAEHRDLRLRPSRGSVDGGSVVRLDQYVDGLPVLGGEVVLGLDRQGGLSSAAASLTSATKAAPATYDLTRARAAARAVVAKAQHGAGPLTVVDEGTWLYDGELIDGPEVGTPTVHRFTVTDGVAVRELVLVDASNGRVLLHFDQVAAAIERWVCDDADQPGSSACTAPVRREGGPVSELPDANVAFEMVGVASDFYAANGIDLTDLLGRDDDYSDGKALRASVRVCAAVADDPECPMQNAFWNGQEVYFGSGWAGADDVTGHELTHGVIEKYSNLFYFHESGALNESLADVMGEIIDHRAANAGETATDWRLGEDLPVGALRDLANPTAHGQPDRMTSPHWALDQMLEDNGGVHTNSGVGNKTAHLISQGGTFNGRTVVGIDRGDPQLTKTAVLFLYAIQHLTSGSQYADLGRVLVQGCQALVASGTAGFVASHCDQVRLATQATELALRPTVATAARPADAPVCPVNTARKALVAPGFTKQSLWFSAPDATVGIPEHSRDGNGSFFGFNPDPQAYGDPSHSSLVGTEFTVPEGQKTYLRFSHWYLFEWEPGATPKYWDGGQARIGVKDADGSFYLATTRPEAWVNGPEDALLLNNPSSPVTGFGGDSRGWYASRLDLSSFAGQTIRTSWMVRGDSSGSFLGWFVDEIDVYTCVPVVHNVVKPSVAGTARVGSRLTASPGTWGPPASVSLTYQWLRNGRTITGAGTRAYTAVTADRGARLSIAVTGAYDGRTLRVISPASAVVASGVIASRTPTIAGMAQVGRRLSARPGTWAPSGLTFRYRWIRDGRVITGATAATYRLTRSDRGHRIQVRVIGSKPGYTTVGRLSARTSRVAR